MRSVIRVSVFLSACVFASVALNADQRDTDHRRAKFQAIMSLATQSNQSGPLGQSNTSPTVDEPPVHIEKVTFPEQRYRIVELFPGLWYWSCNPDAIPNLNLVSLRSRAIRAFPSIASDRIGFESMTKHLGLDKGTQLSDEEKMWLYREYEKLIDIRIELQDGNVKFSLRSVGPPMQIHSPTQNNGDEITGAIEADGKIVHPRKQTYIPIVPKMMRS